MTKNKECQIPPYGIRVVALNQVHGKNLHRLRKISRFEYFQWVAI